MDRRRQDVLDRSLYCGNLSEKVTEELLYELFIQVCWTSALLYLPEHLFFQSNVHKDTSVIIHLKLILCKFWVIMLSSSYLDKVCSFVELLRPDKYLNETVLGPGLPVNIDFSRVWSFGWGWRWGWNRVRIGCESGANRVRVKSGANRVRI